MYISTRQISIEKERETNDDSEQDIPLCVSSQEIKMDDILYFRCRFSPFFLLPYMSLHLLFLTSMTQHTNKTHTFVIIIACEEKCMFAPFVRGNLMCSDVAFDGEWERVRVSSSETCSLLFH